MLTQQSLLTLQLQRPLTLRTGENMQQLFTDHGFHPFDQKICAVLTTLVARAGLLRKKTTFEIDIYLKPIMIA